MSRIPKKLEKDINIVVNNIINYKNIKKLSWMKAYEDILINLNMPEKINDSKFLHYIVIEITERKYDIVLEPFFELKKF